MWIRTQNEEEIHNVCSIEICEIGGRYAVRGCVNTWHTLGTYPTREYALSILDKITENIHMGTKIYDMPL